MAMICDSEFVGHVGSYHVIHVLHVSSPGYSQLGHFFVQVWDGTVICISMGVAGLIYNYSFELTEELRE